MTAGGSQASVPTVGEIARRFPRWLRTNLFAALISAVIGGVFGYVWNVWLIAVRYGGDSKVPGGAPATGDGNFFEGAVFWGVAGAVLFGVCSYWHAVGTQRFFSDLRGLPRALAALISGDHAARVHLLWGAAASMLVAVILAPSLGAVLAIGLLVAAPGVLGSIIANFVGRIWSKLVETFAPTRRHAVTGVTGMTVGLLGAAAALLVAAVIPSVVVKLILVLVLAGAALAVSRIGPPRAASMLLFAAIPILAWLTDSALAFADDGGWQECRYLNEPWLSCPGTPAVLGHAGVGGVAAAVGALGGTFLGAVAGASGGGHGGGPQRTPSPDRPDGDQATGTQGVSPTGLTTGPPGVGPATGPPAVPTGTVVDSRVISGDDARRTLWAATHPPNQPYDPKAPLRAPAGGFPPGISGGGFTTRPDGTIDPDQPIALTVDWHHPAAPPTDQWVTPPQQGFDGNRLAATLKQNFGMPARTITGPDGKTYVQVPENLPPNVAGSAHGTKDIGGQKVFDPDSPIHISHWPKPPPPPPKPKLPKPKLPTPTPIPTPIPTPTPTSTPMPTPTPTPPPKPPEPTPTPKPTPTPTPMPTPTPTPTPTPPTADEMIKAARLAQLKDQQQRDQAQHDAIAMWGSVLDVLTTGGEVVSWLADAGINIGSNLMPPPQGLAFNAAYTTLEDIASGVASGQSREQIATRVVSDNAVNVFFSRLPGGRPTSGIPGNIAHGVANKAVGDAATKEVMHKKYGEN